jgi:hypothetical protein
MPPARFEPANPVSDRPQTNALGRAAAGIGLIKKSSVLNMYIMHLLKILYQIISNALKRYGN